MKTDLSGLNEKKKTSTLGILGCIIGFLALAAAFLSPRIAGAIDPPAPPVEETLVDFATKLKDAAEAKMKGEEYQAVPDEEKPSAILFPAIIGVGMVGSGLGVGSLIRRERTVVAGAAICIGITAAIVQWSILFAAVIVFCLLLFSVCSALGIEFPFD